MSAPRPPARWQRAAGCPWTWEQKCCRVGNIFPICFCILGPLRQTAKLLVTPRAVLTGAVHSETRDARMEHLLHLLSLLCPFLVGKKYNGVMLLCPCHGSALPPLLLHVPAFNPPPCALHSYGSSFLPS